MDKKQNTTAKLILASSSPYRKAVLEKLGLPFAAKSPDIDESPLPDEPPARSAARLAELKCRALQEKYPNHLIIGSDQVAMLDAKQLIKPGNRANAIKQLREASGRLVVFYTGICLLDAVSGRGETEVDRCTVRFRKLSDTQIENYVDRDQPFDCAGSFKSESLGIALFERIEGDDPNALIGLPLIRLIGLLKKYGVNVI